VTRLRDTPNLLCPLGRFPVEHGLQSLFLQSQACLRILQVACLNIVDANLKHARPKHSVCLRLKFID